jgi:predicted transcriptional regulator
MTEHKTVREIMKSVDGDIERIADTAVRVWGIFHYSDGKRPLTLEHISYITGVPEKVVKDCLRILEKRRKLVRKVDGGWISSQ